VSAAKNVGEDCRLISEGDLDGVDLQFRYFERHLEEQTTKFLYEILLVNEISENIKTCLRSLKNLRREASQRLQRPLRIIIYSPRHYTKNQHP
jgi:hypothetical protein